MSNQYAHGRLFYRFVVSNSTSHLGMAETALRANDRAILNGIELNGARDLFGLSSRQHLSLRLDIHTAWHSHINAAVRRYMAMMEKPASAIARFSGVAELGFQDRRIKRS